MFQITTDASPTDSVARHNAHCLVLTANRSEIRPFKSMVKFLHTRNF